MSPNHANTALPPTLKKALPLLLLLATCTMLPAQSYNGRHGRTEIAGDTRVNELVERHIEFNDRVKTISGYRIQIASLSGSNSRDEAFRKKEQFVATFPEVEAYVVFDEPNFKVKIGDFITRLDAFSFLQKMKALYPGVIVKDNIYPIRLNWDDIVPETDDDI